MPPASKADTNFVNCRLNGVSMVVLRFGVVCL